MNYAKEIKELKEEIKKLKLIATDVENIKRCFPCCDTEVVAPSKTQKTFEQLTEKLIEQSTKKKITLKEFWDSDEHLAIYCETKEQAEKIYNEFDKAGRIAFHNFSKDWLIKNNVYFTNDNIWSDENDFEEEYCIYNFEDVIFPDEPKHEFKVGDRVQFKTLEEMENEFGKSDIIGIYIPDGVSFLFAMRHLCGTYATITKINEYGIVNLKNFTASGDLHWNYCLDMLKPAVDEPKWVFTEDEKVILRNVSEEYKWIARDEDDTLYCFKSGYKPNKYEDSGVWNCHTRIEELSPFNHLFQCIKWEDDEPCEFRKYI